MVVVVSRFNKNGPVGYFGSAPFVRRLKSLQGCSGL